MIIVECPQYSEEYWKEKLGKPSASNISKILTNDGKVSKSRDGYLYELAGEILSGQREEAFKSLAMEQGSEREQESRSLFEFTYGVEIKQVGVIYKDEQKRFLCSPDGLVPDQYGLEMKNPLAKTQVKYLLDGGLPPEYFGQVQFSLFITGLPKWMFMSYYPGIKPLILEVEPDEAYQKALAKEINAFCDELDDVVKKIRG